jgi:peptide/nickel transport system substrate-binding protein
MKSFAQGAFLCFLLLGAVACSRRPAQTTAKTDELIVVGPWEMPTLDPLGAGSQFLRMEVTETLVDADEKGILRPGLSSHWSVSKDGREWRFAIPGGIVFQDESPVTPASILPCLRRALKAPGALALAPIIQLTADHQDLVLRLRRPYALIPALFTHSSTQILAPSSLGPSGEVQAIVGTGPYRVISLEQPQAFTVEQFARWRGAQPVFKRVRYISVSRAETRELMAESGQADLAFNLDPASISRLRRQSRIRIVSAIIPRTIALKINVGSPCFHDPRTRQAISLAIERMGIARGLMRDPDLAATQLLPPTITDWYNPSLAPLQTNLNAARALLQDAGWSLHANAPSTFHGECSLIDLRTFSDRPELPLIATAVQEELRQIGLNIRVGVGNSGDVPAGHRDGTLALALIARNYGAFVDPTLTLLTDFPERGGDWGAMNWSSPEVFNSLKTLSEFSPADKTSLTRKITATLQRECPLIPILWYRQNVAVSSRLQNVIIDPFERSYHLSWLQRSTTEH